MNRIFPPSNPRAKVTRPVLVALLCIILLLSACTPADWLTTATQQVTTPATETPTQLAGDPAALVRFEVTIPETPAAEDGVQLSILDEVTGLALNIQRYQMQKIDTTHFWIELAFPLSSVIKYRYTRNGTIPFEEHTTDGRQVRYRLVYVAAPGKIEDIVTRWTDSGYTGALGRLQGKVSDQETGLPLANVLVAAGGGQTLTASDGTFLIEGLPPGIHNLVAYSLDGSYRVFQQGARVAAESTTPANLTMSRAQMVNITFNIRTPAKTPPAVPLRIAGNLYQLGNTYANLEGGFSTVANRMPAMAAQPDGSYTLTLSLPTGTDLRYKYTLGDGFWNAEQAAEGGFRVRQLIVPSEDRVINDEVFSWSDRGDTYLTFDVIIPDDTPPGEYVSIQFNPYSWTAPLPMWPLWENRRVYFLYSPLNRLRTLSYRFCRNDQCNTADAVDTVGFDSSGKPVDLENPQNWSQEQIPGWNWLSQPLPGDIPPEGNFGPRADPLKTGIEFLPAYNPSWQPLMPYSLADLQQMNAGLVVFSPTWTFTRQNPPVLEQVAGQDALWLDWLNAATLARRAGLQVAYFPQPNFSYDTAEWWAGGIRDFSWWVVWFERYRIFLLHHADLAHRTGAQQLIVGGDWLAPALPDGTLLDGSASGVPEDAEFRWRTLLQEIRQHFSGDLIWALPYTPGSTTVPGFIQETDGIYVLWSAGLVDQTNASLEELETGASSLLDEDLYPLIRPLGLPISLGIQYPSAEGGVTGCVPDPQGSCLNLEYLQPQLPDLPTTTLDLAEQADAYTAVLRATATRSWISGIFARGYYPPAVLQDKSVSVHGKPAAAILIEAFGAWRTTQPE
jgi:hypothetical protein